MDNNIYQIERSIKRQIEFLTRHYYEDLEMALNIIDLYK